MDRTVIQTLIIRRSPPSCQCRRPRSHSRKPRSPCCGAGWPMTRAPRAQHERLWLSRQPDRLADTSTWYMTPVKSYADLKSLRDLLQLTGRGDQEALPVLWEDNYLSLLPGEIRVVTATLPGPRSRRRAAAVGR